MSFLAWTALAGVLLLTLALYSAYLKRPIAIACATASRAKRASTTGSIIALSVLVHGMSAQPVLARYERALQRGTGLATQAARMMPPIFYSAYKCLA